MKKSKTLPGHYKKIPEHRNAGKDETSPGDILRELEIPKRTQKPPSAELIARLNEMASKPPFSYLHKAKENDTR